MNYSFCPVKNETFSFLDCHIKNKKFSEMEIIQSLLFPFSYFDLSHKTTLHKIMCIFIGTEGVHSSFMIK